MTLQPQSILSAAWAYRLFGVLIGAQRARGMFAAKYVRAQPGQRVLDIGCGTGNMLPALARTEYVGFDPNPDYIATARALHGGRGSFICAGVEDPVIDTRAPFDLVVACGVLHHLDDTQALQLFRLAHSAMRPGGRLVTLDGCFTSTQGAIARFLLSRDRGRYVRTSEGYRALAAQVFSEVRTIIREDLLWIPYSHVLFECTKGGS